MVAVLLGGGCSCGCCCCGFADARGEEPSTARNLEYTTVACNERERETENERERGVEIESDRNSGLGDLFLGFSCGLGNELTKQ